MLFKKGDIVRIESNHLNTEGRVYDIHPDFPNRITVEHDNTYTVCHKNCLTKITNIN